MFFAKAYLWTITLILIGGGLYLVASREWSSVLTGISAIAMGAYIARPLVRA